MTHATSDDGGWGRDGAIASNMLYVYRPEGIKERVFVETVKGASHEGRLFLHEKCTGNRASYTTEHVNHLLTRNENPERIKERIVELIPRLSQQQKQWLADGISDEALAVVRGIEQSMADMLVSIKHGKVSDRVNPATSALGLE